MSKENFDHADLEVVGRIVAEECEKHLPAFFKAVKARLKNETNVTDAKIRKINRNRDWLGGYAQYDGLERSGPKGEIISVDYTIPFLTIKYRKENE